MLQERMNVVEADFPTTQLATQWEALRAALLHFGTTQAPASDDYALKTACALLDLRAELSALLRRVE